MAKKLYVGNLANSVTNIALEELFSQYGSVRSATVIQDRNTGSSKGFGFVEMADDKSAGDAIRSLNAQMHDGRPLVVNEARPQEDRSGGRRSFSRR